MTKSAPDAAYLDAASKLLDIEIAEEYRAGVLNFLTIAAEMAAALDEAPLDEREQEHAPVYRLPEL